MHAIDMIENTDVEEEKEMPTVRDHRNKQVITTTGGKKLGKIKDLYLDPKLTKVTAAYLGRTGVVNRKKLVIEREKVQTIGADAWLVATGDVVVESSHFPGFRDLVAAKDLHGRKILSEGGTEIATVDDVILDGDCNVKGFSLANYPPSGPLFDRKAIALGALTSVGSKNQPMTTTLAKAESMTIA
jgi:sporulation protein YlmC with PRC-barrel domain